MRRAELLLLLLLAACDPIASFQQAPFVMPSADEDARWRVDINRVVDGVLLPYRPRCIDEVRVGHTVAFRNFAPDIPANVTGIAGPSTLYSPNLVRPYGYVDDEEPYSAWNVTFEAPGVYDWIDTNQGSPGRKVVDAYYGTETFIGIDPDTPIGTVCVLEEDGSGCDGVCCIDDTQCSGGTRCFKSELEAVGRCLTPSG